MASQRPSPPPVTPSQSAVRTPVACPGHLPVPLPTTVACSYPRWLGSWRHAEQQHFSQGPPMVSQPSGHGGGFGVPTVWTALCPGRGGGGEQPPQTGVGAKENIRDMETK